jgi:hypothetical protein
VKAPLRQLELPGKVKAKRETGRRAVLLPSRSETDQTRTHQNARTRVLIGRSRCWTLTFEDGYGGPSHWSNSPNSKNFMASLSPTFHGRSFGTIQEKSKRSPISSGNGSGGITFANVIETRAQLRG